MKMTGMVRLAYCGGDVSDNRCHPAPRRSYSSIFPSSSARQKLVQMTGHTPHSREHLEADRIAKRCEHDEVRLKKYHDAD
jgi:hypothetical protein